MQRPDSKVPVGLNRRRFLQASALAATGWFAGGSFLAGCGDDGGGQQQGSALTIDPNRPWWLQNGYAPVQDEIIATDLPVRGRIPEALNGLYVRNGSNPQNANSPHWFFGDGMLHGVRLENGRPVWYRNRYIQTPLYVNQLDFGTPGLPPTGGNNQSNVSAIYHAGRLITSGEVGFPYEVDPADLSTIGVHDFAGKLNTSFTAHPKIDPATGMMHAFGYWFFQPYLTYHVIDTNGAIVHTQFINVAKTTMIHSFAITEQDVVFWELPVVFNLEAAFNDPATAFAWDPSYGARLGVMPLGGDARDIRWVEIEPCYVFHELNAFRDGNEVVVDVCRHDYMFNNERFGDAPSNVHRWRIDTSGSTLTFRDEVTFDEALELPSHDRRFSGRRHRHGWMLTTRENDMTVDLAGVAAVDYESGRMERWDPGISRHANEAFFVASGANEGEGWLLSYVYDHVADATDLVILDARHVADGPIAEIRLPRRVPHGFHGVWIAD